MSEEKQDTEQTINLSDDDREAALRLLETERSAMGTLFLAYAAFAILVFACPVGLLTVWFERALGTGLLIASAIAMIVIVVIVTTKQNLFDFFTIMGQSVEDSKAGQAIAASAKSSQVGVAPALVGCVGGLAMLLFCPGVGWFLYDLITTRTVNLFSLILVAVPVVVMCLLGYYQMLHYYNISRLRSLLESQAQESGETTVSSEEAAFLRQIKTKQTAREVGQAVLKARWQAAEGYSIVINEKVRECLERLPAEQTLTLRRIIYSLQLDPRPVNAESVVIEDTDLLILREGNSAIVYHVDEETLRVVVVDIRDTVFSEEVEDAS